MSVLRQLGVLVLLCGGANLAGAEEPPKTAPKAPKVIQLEEVQIEGRVQKPNAFYILNRSNLGYEVTDLRTRFGDKIIRAVADAPF